MTLVLDAGALIALEGGDRAAWRQVQDAVDAGDPPISHGGVVAQVWRGRGPREALLARALVHLEVRSLDEDLGRRAGLLLAGSSTADAIDAAVVALARDGDHIVTSLPADIAALVVAAKRQIEIIAA
jgi:hypothetical protein